MITFASETDKNKNNYEQFGNQRMVVAKLRIQMVVRSLPYVRLR